MYEALIFNLPLKGCAKSGCAKIECAKKRCAKFEVERIKGIKINYNRQSDGYTTLLAAGQFQACLFVFFISLIQLQNYF